MSSKPLHFEDFYLEISDLNEDGTFTVRVIGQTPGGELRADQVETRKFNPDDIKLLLLKLEKRKNLTREDLFTLGGKLNELLLPGEVGRLFDASVKALKGNEGLRLRLRIESLQLSALPWEYTFRSDKPGQEPTDFLGLRPKISITRYETVGPPLKPFVAKDSVRIVAALASPLDQVDLNLEEDRQAIETAIAALEEEDERAKGLIKLTLLEAATRADLNRELPGADIFQFSGHGVFEPVELKDGGIPLKRGRIILANAENLSDPFDSDQLAVLLQDSSTRLVVLGACNSAARDSGGSWTGVAPALMRAEVPAVIAMQYRVRDTNAATFIATVYRLLLYGYSLDEAVQRGRLTLFSTVGLEDRDWGVPVVYLRAKDSFLFQRKEADGGRPGSILVRQELGEVAGEVIGARVRRMMGGQIEVHETIRRVERGGKVVGVDLGDALGGEYPADFDEPRES
jgi:hypothetical protein